MKTRIRVGLPLVAALVGLAGCSDPSGPATGPETPDAPAFAISDAAHGGTDGFNFLPPLVPAPETTGTFDGSLAPTVQICEGETESCSGSEVALFTTETGPGSETIRVDETEEQYVVSWHTDEFDLVAGDVYRVSVLVAGTLLGYADVVPAANGAEMKSITTNENFALKDGRTLPVKFRVETGTVFPVGSAGGTITAEDGAVVLEIPEGALSEEAGITIEPSGEVGSGVGLLAGAVHDFEPDGLEFSDPASLTLAFELPDGLSASELAVLDELEAGEWNELVSSIDGSANTATAPIDGFSRKGVGKRADAVEVSPTATELDLADNNTVQFSATVLDASGAELTKRNLVWSVGDESVATVDNNGLVTAVGDGTTYVETKAGRASDRADVTVGNEPPAATINSPTEGASFLAGEAITFEGSASDPEDGTLTGASLVWTSDLDGEIGTGTSFTTALSVGTHTVALTVTDADGATGSTGVSITVRESGAWLSVSAGATHTCGVLNNGDGYCWGDGGDGQLGTGKLISEPGPELVLGELSFTSIDAGGNHSCGTTLAGEAWCWGEAYPGGALGDGSLSDSEVPVRVQGDVPFRVVRAGESSSCGLANDGSIYCWGYNVFGQLGDGTTENRSSPVAVQEGLTAQQLEVGNGTTCAVTDTNDAYCWGDGGDGQIGDGFPKDRSTPRLVSGRLEFQKVVPGGNHTCGITTSGEARCWGSNVAGQRGDGTGRFDLATPQAVATNLNLQDISAGDFHSCGVTTAGEVWCWGQNSRGQLGDGTFTERFEPVQVLGLGGVTQVSAGSDHTCARTVDGAIYCWGRAISLGDSYDFNESTFESSTPVRVVTP